MRIERRDVIWRGQPDLEMPPILLRREKFVYLAENRTRNALKAIRVIAKLGNKNAYNYTEADVKKIAIALTKEIEALKARMLSIGGKDFVDFKL